MGWNGSGSVVRTDGTRTGATVFTQARDASVKVNAPDHDRHDQDLADAIENAVARDGQNSPSANLPMGGRKHTGVADATANSEYAAYGQLLAIVTPFVGAAGVGGTADAITLTPSPAITSYTVGSGYRFFTGSTANTGAVTLAVSGLAATPLLKADGTPLAAGQLTANRYVIAIYNGVSFVSSVVPPTALDFTATDSKIRTLTQAAYDAISPDSATLYFIAG